MGIRLLAVLAAALAISGCATVQYGDKDTQARLQKLQPVPGKTSLYVCREQASFAGAGNRTTAVVNKRPIGTLKPGNFAHTLVDPGEQEVYIKLNPGGESGTLALATQAGEVAYVWVGMTGGGWGVLTVDHFKTKREAEQCVRDAEYAVQAEQ